MAFDSYPSTSSGFPSSTPKLPLCKPITERLPYCTAADQQMLLHFSEREYVLFSFWKTGSAMGMFGSCILVILLCILSEVVELCRNFLAKEHALTPEDDSDISSISSDTPLTKTGKILRRIRNSFTPYRVTQATLYGLHIMFGHVLILIIVSFNVWLLIAVAFGKAIGYFLFQTSPVIEQTARALEAASPPPGRRTLNVPTSLSTDRSSPYLFDKGFHSHTSSGEI